MWQLIRKFCALGLGLLAYCALVVCSVPEFGLSGAQTLGLVALIIVLVVSAMGLLRGEPDRRHK